MSHIVAESCHSCDEFVLRHFIREDVLRRVTMRETDRDTEKHRGTEREKVGACGPNS